MQPFIKCFIIFIICIIIQGQQAVFFKFTKITCESKDPDFLTVNYCSLHEMDQSLNAIRMKYLLHQLPLNEITFHFNFMIKSQKWVSFIYEIDVDICKFFKRQYNSLAKMCFSLIEGYTNLNHTCPYNHDIVFNDIFNNNTSSKLKGLPLSKGQYAVFVKWIFKNVTRAETKIYVKVIDV